MSMNKIKLYINTIKYLKIRQIYYRLYYKFRNIFFKKYLLNKYYKNVDFKINENFLKERNSRYKKLDKTDTSSNILENIKNLKFTFLNKTYQFKNNIDWNYGNYGKFNYLWNYNLHYFDYLRDVFKQLIITGINYNDYNIIKNLINDWISHNYPLSSRGYEPYAISRRVVVFIHFYTIFYHFIKNDKAFEENFTKNLYRQLRWLRMNIEYHVDGNHLLENAFALTKGSLLFNSKESKEWFKTGYNLLTKELEVEFLADGGHYEKSPMYHGILLEGLIETIIFFNDAKIEIDSFLFEKAYKAVIFFENILHPDGKFPLFNDSIYDPCSNPLEIIQLGKKICNNKSFNNDLITFYLGFKNGDSFCSTKYNKDVSLNNDSGYYVIRENNNLMIIDGGTIGPDFVPGHAHCDILSYEFSYNKNQIVVDSGVYEYAEGDFRKFNRGTSAHNVVMINHQEQSEMWASFRVGKRAYPKNIKFKKYGQNYQFIGSHTGYDKMGIEYKREIYVIDNSYWIVIDNIINKHNKIMEIENFIHFHPNTIVKRIDNKKYFINNELYLIMNNFEKIETLKGSLKPIQGWYSPMLGKKYKNITLIGRNSNIKIQTSYIFTKKSINSFIIQKNDNKRIIILNEEKYAFEI